jgi:hypothetical protein
LWKLRRDASGTASLGKAAFSMIDHFPGRELRLAVRHDTALGQGQNTSV